jgi:hypothetical protein
VLAEGNGLEEPVGLAEEDEAPLGAVDETHRAAQLDDALWLHMLARTHPATHRS